MVLDFGRTLLVTSQAAIDWKVIEKVPCYKYLGFYFMMTLNYKDHMLLLQLYYTSWVYGKIIFLLSLNYDTNKQHILQWQSKQGSHKFLYSRMQVGRYKWNKFTHKHSGKLAISEVLTDIKLQMKVQNCSVSVANANTIKRAWRVVRTTQWRRQAHPAHKCFTWQQILSLYGWVTNLFGACHCLPFPLYSRCSCCLVASNLSIPL